MKKGTDTFLKEVNQKRKKSVCPFFNNRSGFTFIELLVTLVLLSISILPLLNMFSTALEESNGNIDLTNARYLAQEGMEKMRNLSMTVPQLKDIGDTWDPPLSDPPYKVDNSYWRIFRDVDENTRPLEVVIKVFKEEDIERDGEKARPLVELATLVEDFEWEYYD